MKPVPTARRPSRCAAARCGAVGALLAGALLDPAHAAGTLTVCTEGPPEGFDVVQYESALAVDAAGLALYDQLTHFKPGTTELEPGLAESWSVSPDGLAVTFKLRRGVKFHSTPWFRPTRDFNADDVLFSINRLLDKNSPAHAIAKSGYVYWEGMSMSSLIRSVSKLDEFTVRFTLSRPEAPFVADMAMPTLASMYSAEYAAQLLKDGRGEQLNTQPIGTGPFVFKSYQKDAVIRYAAHTAYWAGAPKIDNLIFAITVDPSVRVQRLKAGECLVGTNMKAEVAAAFENDPQVQMVHRAALISAYITPNAKHRFTSDRRLREALWLALDKKTYIQSVYGGNAAPAGSFLPPTMWGFDKSLADRHDPERARQLVKASGYDGSELVLFARIGGSIDGKRAAELMQADWAKVGIKVKLQMMEWGELLKRAGRGEHDISFQNWASDNGDPDNFFTPTLSCSAVASGGNKSQWCNPAFDQLLDTARKSSDLKKRSELYTQAQRLLYDDVGVIPMVYPVYMTAVNRRVLGYVPDPFTNNDFRGVSLKP